MSIIVQKFGGTSVADSKKILAAARKAIRAQNEGNQVVMVVSAMGKNTDLLIDLAKQITDEPPAREMDMLLSTGEQVSVALMAMAIHSLGHQAISLTGAQIGIITDSTHTKARIRSISTERIRKALDEGNIVIAAGFQGIDEANNITTLGRGGSDTTAVALAAVLNADACEIYTDVDGVYTTDPRIVPEARQVKQISYDEMLELATAGAGVMHNRSIEFAKKFNVPVHVRSSFSDNPGHDDRARPGVVGVPVCGAAMAKDEARVTVLGVPDRPGRGIEHLLEDRRQEHRHRHDRAERGGRRAGPTSRSPSSATICRPRCAPSTRPSRNSGPRATTTMRTCRRFPWSAWAWPRSRAWPARCSAPWPKKGINIHMITTSEIKISALVAREFAPGGPAGGARGVSACNVPPAGAASIAAAVAPTRRNGRRRDAGRPAAADGKVDHRATSTSTSRSRGSRSSACPTRRDWPPRSSTSWPRRALSSI